MFYLTMASALSYVAMGFLFAVGACLAVTLFYIILASIGICLKTRQQTKMVTALKKAGMGAEMTSGRIKCGEERPSGNTKDNLRKLEEEGK